MSSPASPDDQTDAQPDDTTDTVPEAPISVPESVPQSHAEADATGGESSESAEPPVPAAVVASVVVPDRADAPISEITERFFKSLLTKVPLDRIEELHLFSPLRQGGVETGIAVIAAREEIVLVPEPLELPLSLEDAAPAVDSPVVDSPVVAADDRAESGAHGQHLAVDDAADGSSEPDLSEVPDDGAVAAEPPDAELADSELVPSEVQDADLPDAESIDTLHVEPVHVEPVHVEPVPQADGAEPTAPVIRHTVYTARYRLVQKGPERGKWESEVVAEAEAPLITVEMVVRGVQRRAGEESDTTRFTQAQIARALRLDPGVVR